jgi:hypothetical protein
MINYKALIFHSALVHSQQTGKNPEKLVLIIPVNLELYLQLCAEKDSALAVSQKPEADLDLLVASPLLLPQEFQDFAVVWE